MRIFFPSLHEMLKLFCPTHYGTGALEHSHELNSASNQVQDKNRSCSDLVIHTEIIDSFNMLIKSLLCTKVWARYWGYYVNKTLFLSPRNVQSYEQHGHMNRKL